MAEVLTETRTRKINEGESINFDLMTNAELETVEPWDKSVQKCKWFIDNNLSIKLSYISIVIEFRSS